MNWVLLIGVVAKTLVFFVVGVRTSDITYILCIVYISWD